MSRVQLRLGKHVVEVSNLDKVWYPETGFTKGQVIDYYVRVSPVLLPHLRNRPVTLKRYPDGVAGFHFCDHAAELVLTPGFEPPAMVTVLLAVPGITACGLDVPCRRPADPNPGPRRGNRESANPAQFPLVPQTPTVRKEVPNCRPGPHPADARLAVRDVAESCLGRRDLGRRPAGAQRVWHSRTSGAGRLETGSTS